VLGNDTDVDGDLLTALLVDDVDHGTLVLNADGSFTYTPDENFNGPDSFTYRAGDGTANSELATVALTVTPINDAPAAANDAFTTDEDTPLLVAAPGVLGNDPNVDGDALTALLVAGPAHGELTLNADGSFTYTPDENFNGLDSFSYRASDGTLESDVALVDVTITAVNDAPAAVADAYEVDQKSELVVPAGLGLLANDTDVEGDALTAGVVTGPANGTLVLAADGSFRYTPRLGFVGEDVFTYAATDAGGAATPATVTIEVKAIPPINVDALVRVTQSGMVLNRATNTFDTLVTITNISTDSVLLAPMSLVVTTITPATVTLANATGLTPDGKPFVAVTIPEAGVGPGASVSNILLKFNNPTRGRFSFTPSVLAVDPPAAPAAVAEASGPGRRLELSVLADGTRTLTTGGPGVSAKTLATLAALRLPAPTPAAALASPPSAGAWVRSFLLDLAADRGDDANAGLSLVLRAASVGL
jgi:VCBS repeat-containing protein